MTRDAAGRQNGRERRTVSRSKGRDMKHPYVVRFLGVVAWFVVVLLAGCQQQQPTPSEKQARLISAENIELKRSLTSQQAQVETLRQQHAKELEQHDQELAQCKARNEQLRKDIEEGIAQRVKEVTAAVVTENARLREQIKELQAQIESLKAQPRPSDPNQQVP
jgi:DNA anti-recombination protein RmuC